MNDFTLRDAWIKAAVEHRTLRIKYKFKDKISLREVDPYYIYPGPGWEGFGCWGFCRFKQGVRMLNVDGILEWESTENTFKADPNGRWLDLVNYYGKNHLSDIPWPSKNRIQ